MTVSVAVMAHPKRAAMVDELLADLDRPAKVVWDEINDRHDTGIRAIEAFDPTASHHLVIQDDVLPCRDLVAGVEAAAAYVPDGHPASFYVGRVRPFAGRVQEAVDAAEGASWIVMDGIYWGPAIMVPTVCIDELARWFRSPQARRVQNYDKRTSTWFERQGLACWYSWPSLVDHRGDESLVRRSDAIRRAHRFAGEGVSAKSIDWSGPVARMTRTDRLDRQRQQRARRAAARR